ncbi:hypothetical protein JMJ77_0006771, partial [Colletotrichum scovillei]
MAPSPVVRAVRTGRQKSLSQQMLSVRAKKSIGITGASTYPCP